MKKKTQEKNQHLEKYMLFFFYTHTAYTFEHNIWTRFYHTHFFIGQTIFLHTYRSRTFFFFFDIFL